MAELESMAEPPAREQRRGGRLANALPVAGLRDQISEVSELLDATNGSLVALLAEARQTRVDADATSERLQLDFEARRRAAARRAMLPARGGRAGPAGAVRRGAGAWPMEREMFSLQIHTLETDVDDDGGCRDCSICLEALVAGQQVTTLDCLHTFHASCVGRWRQTKGANASCPLCKRPLVAGAGLSDPPPAPSPAAAQRLAEASAGVTSRLQEIAGGRPQSAGGLRRGETRTVGFCPPSTLRQPARTLQLAQELERERAREGGRRQAGARGGMGRGARASVRPATALARVGVRESAVAEEMAGTGLDPSTQRVLARTAVLSQASSGPRRL